MSKCRPRISRLRRQDDVFDLQGLTRDDITDTMCGTDCLAVGVVGLFKMWLRLPQ